MFPSTQKYLVSVTVFILTVFYLAVSPCSAQITIGGTGNALGTMKKIAEAYQQTHPEVEIKVLPNIGSSGAIKAVPAGRIQIGLSARPLKKAELKKGIVTIDSDRSQCPTVEKG